MEYSIDYKKYKWFFTRSKKLVVGGKNSLQNDELLTKIKSLKKSFLVMHTASPGSPFSIILSDLSQISKNDIEECAVFTACFSQSWNNNLKKVKVSLFNISQLNKDTSMKEGTWSVSGKSKEILAPLKLVLTLQENILRAVPQKTVTNKEDILLTIIPGKEDKNSMLSQISKQLGNRFKNDEILSALPAKGLKIIK